MSIKKLLLRLIVAVIFGYLIFRLYKTWGDLAAYDFHFNYIYLILAVLVFILFYLMEGIGYYITVLIVNARVPFKKVLKARYISDMGRYVPGKVWTVLGRLYFLRKYEITKLQVVLSSLVELAVMGLGAVLAFALSLLFWDIKFDSWVYLTFLVIPCVLIAVHPKVLNFLINIIEKIRKKEQVRLKAKYWKMLTSVLFYLVYWMVYGIGAFLLVNAITPMGLEILPLIAGIFAITWLIGFASFIAPGGLGVRDGLLVYFMMFLVPEPIAIIVALTARIVLSVIEGLYALVSFKF